MKTPPRKRKAKKKLGSTVLWLLISPQEKQPEFPMHCIGDKKVTLSILIFSRDWRPVWTSSAVDAAVQ